MVDEDDIMDQGPWRTVVTRRVEVAALTSLYLASMFLPPLRSHESTPYYPGFMVLLGALSSMYGLVVWFVYVPNCMFVLAVIFVATRHKALAFICGFVAFASAVVISVTIVEEGTVGFGMGYYAWMSSMCLAVIVTWIHLFQRK